MSLIARLRKNVRDRAKRTTQLAKSLSKEERAGRWRQKRTEHLRKLANKSPEDLERFRRSRTLLRRQRGKVGRLRKQVGKSRAKLSHWRLLLSRASGTPGGKAVKAAGRMVGKVETGQNDAAWLRQMERDLVKAGANLGWMIPGNPYCGFGDDWSWLTGAHKLLPDDTVNTVAIANRARSGNRFRRVSLNDIEAGDLVVMHFGSGGPKHVGLARGPMRGGVIPTREFNTSSGNSGSQANGGGVWDRKRSSWLVHTVARPI